MIVTKCSIAGIDDKTNLEDLLELTRDYPFVEWSVLSASKDRQGTPRYPSKEWEINFLNSGLNNTSLHLCGPRVKEWLEDYKRWTLGYRRVQLNISRDWTEFQTQVIRKTLVEPDLDIIIPIKEGTHNIWKMGNLSHKIQFLFDSSGGFGRTPDGWPSPIAGSFCGYAGGLKPENIEEELTAIEDTVGHGYIWVDLESGARNENNEFDPARAKACLEAVKPYTIEA